MNAFKGFSLVLAALLIAACETAAPVTTEPPITEAPTDVAATPTAIAVVPTGTDVPVPPTFPPTVEPTPTEPAAPTPTDTATPTATATATPTQAPTATPTATPTRAPTPTPTDRPSPTPTPTPTDTPDPTPTPTATPNPNGDMVLLGRWITKFSPGPTNGNGANIRVPAQVLDGTIVKPGELFQFVDAIEPVTEGRGYAEGCYLKNGQIQCDPGILGGGMCSASTTLFNAAMRAGLRIVERHNHAIYISRYPVGLDATVFSVGKSDGQDVKFVNDTGHNVVIRSYGGRRKVTFEVWGVDDGRTVDLGKPVVTEINEAIDWYEYSDELAPGDTSRTQDKYDGFRSAVTRTVRDRNGNVIWRDTWSSKYRVLDGVILVGRYKGDPPAGTRIKASDYPGKPNDPDPSDPPPSGDPPPTAAPRG